jgi:hypothetical protein
MLRGPISTQHETQLLPQNYDYVAVVSLKRRQCKTRISVFVQKTQGVAHTAVSIGVLGSLKI